MKMQNTEIEFVTFDAQDVIATSGEVCFAGSATDTNGFPLGSALSWGMPYGMGNDGTRDCVLYVKGSIGEYAYYLVNSATYNVIDEIIESDCCYYLDCVGVDTAPAGADIKDTYGSILSWLQGNATRQ